MLYLIQQLRENRVPQNLTNKQTDGYYYLQSASLLKIDNERKLFNHNCLNISLQTKTLIGIFYQSFFLNAESFNNTGQSGVPSVLNGNLSLILACQNCLIDFKLCFDFNETFRYNIYRIATNHITYIYKSLLYIFIDFNMLYTEFLF